MVESPIEVDRENQTCSTSDQNDQEESVKSVKKRFIKVSGCSSYSLLLCGLFYESICCMSLRVSFYSCVVFFSPFSIAITSLGEERANLGAFRTFVRFVLVWICRFPLPLGVWEGLRFVVVALPGLLSYLFSEDCDNFLRDSINKHI